MAAAWTPALLVGMELELLVSFKGHPSDSKEKLPAYCRRLAGSIAHELVDPVPETELREHLPAQYRYKAQLLD